MGLDTTTLESGAPTFEERFKGLASSEPRTKVNPRFSFGLLCGKPGDGKSTLLSSCPTALMLNFDKASFGSTCQAGVWPTRNEEGELVDENGERMKSFDFPATKKILDRLVDMAEKGVPRPDMVAFDTLAGFTQQVREHMMKEARVEHWREMPGHGPSNYDVLYNKIGRSMTRLHNAGYGVWGVVHIDSKSVPVGEDQYRMKPHPTIYNGLWRAIHWQSELSIVVRREKKASVRKEKGRTVRGAPQIVHIVTVNDPEFEGIARGRHGFEDLTLPATNQWKAFEEAYMSSDT